MIGKLLSLGPRGWLELLEAQWWIFHAQTMLKIKPVGTLATSSNTKTTQKQTKNADTARKSPEDIARAIDRVASFGFWRPLCLARSIALQNMLLRHHVPGSEIRVGIRKTDSGLDAHAWVELDKKVLGDDPAHVARFIRVDDLSLLPVNIR